MKERILCFPFGFRANLVLRRHRVPRTMVFRTEDAVAIEETDECNLELAYRVKQPLWRHCRRFDVFRHRGRLWWPALPRSLSEQHDTRQSLVEGLGGRINLFGENIYCADAPTFEQVFVKKFGWSDREAVHAEMQRKAKDFLLVEDRLFIAAGVPIVIPTDFMPVVGTGDGRLGETADADAWDIEGWGRAEYSADCEICADNFWIPGFGPPTEAMMRVRLSDVPGTTIPVEAIAPEPVDRFQLRVDAAFRIVRHRLFDRRYSVDPSLKGDLRPFFERAQSHDASLLTRRRITALSACVDLSGTDWLLERFGTSTTQGILHLLSVANDSPHLCPEEGALGDLTEWAAEDEDALSLIETG